MRFRENIFKYISLFIAASAVMLLLYIFASLTVDYAKDNTFAGPEEENCNSGINNVKLVEYLNTLPDYNDYERIKSLSGGNTPFYLAVFIIPLGYSVLVRLQRKNFRIGEIICFGIFVSICLSLLFNIIFFLNFETWTFHNATEVFLNSVCIGILSSVYSVTINALEQFVKMLIEESPDVWEALIRKTRSENVSIAFAFARMWVFVSAGLSLVLAVLKYSLN